jgi:hypothetical protein
MPGTAVEGPALACAVTRSEYPEPSCRSCAFRGREASGLRFFSIRSHRRNQERVRLGGGIKDKVPTPRLEGLLPAILAPPGRGRRRTQRLCQLGRGGVRAGRPSILSGTIALLGTRSGPKHALGGPPAVEPRQGRPGVGKWMRALASGRLLAPGPPPVLEGPVLVRFLVGVVRVLLSIGGAFGGHGRHLLNAKAGDRSRPQRR